jgi:threonine dehydratase
MDAPDDRTKRISAWALRSRDSKTSIWLRFWKPRIEQAIIELHERAGWRVEGAGAIAYAAHHEYGGAYQNPAVIISGGNIDDDLFRRLTQRSEPD